MSNFTVKWEEQKPETIVPGMTTLAREGHGVFFYKDEIYIFGGATIPGDLVNEEEEEEEGYEGSDCNTIFKFNTEKKEWEEVECQGEIPTPRSGFASALIDNNYYVFGGLDSLEGWKNDMYVLDIETKNWERLKPSGAVPSPRDKAACCVVDEHTLILFGGFGPISPSEILQAAASNGDEDNNANGEDEGETATFSWFNTTFTFDIRECRWTQLTVTGGEDDVPTPRAAMGGCVFRQPAGDVYSPAYLYIVGGRDNLGKRTNSVHSLNLETLSWKKHLSGGVELSARSFHQIRSVGGFVALFGGLDNEFNLLSDLLLFHVEKNEWQKPVWKRSGGNNDNQSEEGDVPPVEMQIPARCYFGMTQSIYQGAVVFYVHGGSSCYEEGQSVDSHFDIWKVSFEENHS